MIDEHDDIAQPPNAGSIVSRGRVDKVGVRELSNEVRNLGSHPVLLCECLVRIPFQHETLKHGSVQVITFALLDSQRVIIHFGPQLPEDKIKSSRGFEFIVLTGDRL